LSRKYQQKNVLTLSSKNTTN